MRYLLKTSLLACLLWSSFMGASVSAKVVDDLNVISVIVADQSLSTRNRTIDRALETVLVRYTGLAPETITSAVRSNRISAAQYLQRFQYQLIEPEQKAEQNSEAERHLILVFDPIAISRLLKQINLPEWSNNRPELLVWIAIGDKGYRFLLGPDHPVKLEALLKRHLNDPFSRFADDFSEPSDNQATQLTNDISNDSAPDPLKTFYLQQIGTDENLQQRLTKLADERALPILFPLLDLEDNMALDSGDVWGQFLAQIRHASERYDADAILTGRIELTSAGWLTDWLLIDASFSGTWQVSSDTLTEALDEGLERAIIRIAEQFSVVQDTTTTQTIPISVSGIQSTSQLAALETYLLAQTAVADITVTKVTSTEVYYRLSLIGELDNLLQSIRLEQRILETEATQLTETGSDLISSRPALYFRWND